MKKRILAICMALCMMLSAVPVAFAAEGDAPIFEISDTGNDELDGTYTSIPEAMMAYIENGQPVCKMYLLDDAEISIGDNPDFPDFPPIGIWLFGNDASSVLDLGGHTLTVTGTGFAIISLASSDPSIVNVIQNGKIILNGENLVGILNRNDYLEIRDVQIIAGEDASDVVGIRMGMPGGGIHLAGTTIRNCQVALGEKGTAIVDEQSKDQNPELKTFIYSGQFSENPVSEDNNSIIFAEGSSPLEPLPDGVDPDTTVITSEATTAMIVKDGNAYLYDTLQEAVDAAESKQTGSGAVQISLLKQPEDKAVTLPDGVDLTIKPLGDADIDTGAIDLKDSNGQKVEIDENGKLTPAEIKVTGVELDKTTLSLVEGTTGSLTATVAPENATDTTVTWASDNPSVAAVDQSGKITAVSEGTATITATANGDSTKAATCTVTVKPDSVPAESVTLNKTALTLEIGDTATLTATITPADTTDQPVWSSSDESVVTVDQSGKITAVGRGEATVTVKAGEASATCTVEVQRTYIPIPPTQPTRPTRPAEPDEPDTPDEPEEPVVSELPFTDVAVEDEFYEAVKYVSENGLMTGVDTTAFAPYNEFTRAQVATILYRLEKEPAVAYAPTFPDVTEDQWFAQAVLWGNSKGILLGHDTGLFGPDDGVTFEQMLTILYRYAALKGYDTAARADVSGFECSDYAAEAVSWAMAHGMVSAADGAALKAPAARCQVAQVLAVFCQTVVMK